MSDEDRIDELYEKQVSEALGSLDLVMDPVKPPRRGRPPANPATPQGHKRYATNKSSIIKPIKGLNQDLSDTLRTLAALHLTGYSIQQMANQTKISVPTIRKYIQEYETAFEQAVQDHLLRNAREYGQNLFMLKSATSRIALRAMETIESLLQSGSKRVTPKVKADLSLGLLKLVNVDGMLSADDGAEKVANSFASLLKKATEKLDEKSIHVIDVEDAEVIEEEDDADRVHDPVQYD